MNTDKCAKKRLLEVLDVRPRIRIARVASEGLSKRPIRGARPRIESAKLMFGSGGPSSVSTSIMFATAPRKTSVGVIPRLLRANTGMISLDKSCECHSATICRG